MTLATLRRGARSGHATSAWPGALAWLESLSPWPEEFGLGRMRALLASLGEPQRAFPAIHVVGTNGKTSTTLMCAALLRAAGLRVGAYISPHVRGWAERIQVDGEHADLERALARVRPHAEGATQFEVLTAAALAEFAAREVDVAVVEAGLGGRHDATNVLDAPVVVLTNVALDHTDVLGDDARGDRGREARGDHARRGRRARRARVGGGRARARRRARRRDRRARTSRSPSPPPRRSSASRSIRTRPRRSRIPGRLERRSERPLELWDGAHNIAGRRLPARPPAAAPLHDRRVDPRATRTSTRCCARSRPSATRSSRPAPRTHARCPPASSPSARAPYFAAVEAVDDPRAAVETARGLAGEDGAVLVTGSLYLLAELSSSE